MTIDPTPGLTLDLETHTYRLNGVVIPDHITGILEAEGLVDFSAVSESVLDHATWRGSAVHLACLLDDQGDLDESTVDPEALPYLDAFRLCRRNLNPTILAAEVSLYHPIHKYCGTLDRVVAIGPDGPPGVCQVSPCGHRQVWEIKTGELQPAAAYQTAAQVMLLPNPYTYRRFAVRLRKNGAYVMHEYPLNDLQDDFAVFLAALKINRVKRGIRK
jgi:hypothetical protein